MQISQIRINNYLGIKQFKADNLGKINLISGGNGAGKSSLQKAIQEAFRGSGKDLSVINNNADKAEIVLLFNNGLEVERKITQANNTVKVTENGSPVSKPVAFLKAILGDTAFNFNPVQFLMRSRAERRDMLLKCLDFKLTKEQLEEEVFADEYVPENLGVSLDRYDYGKNGLELLEQVQADLYASRREQNRHVTRLQKALEQDRKDMPETTIDPNDFKGFDIDRAITDLREAERQIGEHESDKRELSRLADTAKTISAEIDELKAKIAQRERQLAEIDEAGGDLNGKVKGFIPPNVEAQRERISAYQGVQKLTYKIEEMEKREIALDEQKQLHERMDDCYKYLTTGYSQVLLSRLNLPVDGLELKGDDILVDGVPIDKLNTAKQVEFAVSMAKVLAGDLKVICVDDFEHMDKAHRKAFLEIAANDDFEYFIALVTDGQLMLKIAS